MLVPGIFKLGRVSIMLQIWHLDFMHLLLPVMVGMAKILVLTSICLRLGGCLYAQCCAAEQVFGGRHVAVAFPFFHNRFVYGDNGQMVCLYDRQAVR